MSILDAKLATVLADPQRVDEVPSEAVPAMMAQCAALQSALAARMLSADIGSKGRRQEASTEELLTVPEVAAYLKVQKNRIYNLVRRGELDSKRIGKYIRIPVEAVQQYLDKQSQKILENDMYHRYTKGRDRSRTPKTPKKARTHTDATRRADRSHGDNGRKVGKRRAGNLGTRLTFPQAAGEDGED